MAIFRTLIPDTSDGLITDLSRLCAASSCGAEIVQNLLPVDPRARRAASELNLNVDEFVLHGGDDYELLFTVPAPMEEALGDLSTATKVPLTRIGVMTESKGVKDHRGRIIKPRGWDPFTQGKS